MLKRIKKRYILTIILFGIAILTNPKKDEYIQFTEETIGEPAIDVEVEQINFVIFSSYTPIIFGEHGITHLGIFGQFIQISEGQFDYPAWLELFN
ncbi:hypothetical protein FGG79_03790 [Bacillus sp. BHET2]|uniref:hypothetical protein n=1 Tax=Bacillus sp. BHET2 TaxID=2583818 RepID=UPI00110F6053|nr:hypothetical protein [Bacillus sp. BHET2]TMU87261.1 hypothetical protein FGG79_03790 [Bacillus sp. BHET2]